MAAAAAPELADAGITGAERGVAATGSLVLTYGAGRGRGVGLLPDIHITLLAADRIVADLPTALELAYAGSSPPSAITVITGPSASSDIEKIRVTGVHGPRRMGVVVVG
jgi:L-lactate dehydrogenase complex protein LldG